ncbi:MAG TPA: DUF5916 domain-containing protein [Gammaproteobacteria bacterium]
MKTALLYFSLALLSTGALADPAPAEPPNLANYQPHLTVPRIDHALVIDGDLSKPEWQQAAVIPDLLQVLPFTGQPTPFHTQVRLLRDNDHLYVAVHAIDPEPGKVLIHSLQRDANQDPDDHITIVINTFDDHQNAYAYRINAGGARDDGLEANGSTNADFGWDGIWEVKTRRVADGWDAEIAFSTRSLQFDTAVDHWGFNVSRSVPRFALVTKWAYINAADGTFSPSRYGIIDGMAGLQSGSGLEINPYILARSDQIDPSAKRAEVGGEVKYNFTPQLEGTLTVNTDFAQTEADSQQINLSRFSLFFPEKRQFFLDGSSFFAFNGGNMNGNLNGGFTAFYSRDIGLAMGQTVPIDDGAKLAGHIGDLSLGVLDVDTGSVSGISGGVPTENLFVGRFTYDLGQSFRIGTLLTRGDPSGRTDASFNGADLAWQTFDFLGQGKAFKATAWDANTSGAANPGLTRGYGYELTYPNYTWYGDLQMNQFGDAFNLPLGFVARPGTRQYWEEFGWFPTPTPPSSINYWQIDQQYNQIDDLSGRLQSYQAHFIPGVYFTDSSQFYPQLFRQYEAVAEPFAIDNNVAIPQGIYRFQRWQVEYDSPVSYPVRFTLRPSGGGFYSGNAKDEYWSLAYAGFEGRLELGLTNEDVFADLPQGHFVQKLWQLNAAWSFTPDLNITSFVQYDTSQDQLGFNTRLHWAITADKDLYVVWNRNWRESVMQISPGTPDVADTFIVKLAWNFSR